MPIFMDFQRFFYFLLVLFFCEGSEIQFEGPWKASLQKDSHLFNDAYLFLPYNPTIVVFSTARVEEFSTKYPLGKIYVFSPKAKTFQELLGEFAFYPNVTLSNAAFCWLDEGVDYIDLDLDGLEASFIQNLGKMLENVKVIRTKTYFTSYDELKTLLQERGFELLSHWYFEGESGEATFIHKKIYDALFI